MRYYSKRRKASMSFDLRQNGYLERSRIRSMRLKSRIYVRECAVLGRQLVYGDHGQFWLWE